MEEILNTVNDVQVPVVEASQEVLTTAESGSETEQQADLTPRTQSREENASFRRMRLENERLREENERLTGDAVERKMAEDLALIRSMDESVGSLEELGEEFAALIAAGVSATVAFAALRQAKEAVAPPKMGAVGSGRTGEKTFYSPAEVDALSASDLTAAAGLISATVSDTAARANGHFCSARKTPI